MEAAYSLTLTSGQVIAEQLYLRHGAHVFVISISSMNSAGNQAVALTVSKSWHWH